MKSFKQIVCLAVVVLITALVAFEAAAELPRTREIRDKLMWGDPDYPLTKERDCPWPVIGPGETAQMGYPAGQTWYVLSAPGFTARIPVSISGRLPEHSSRKVSTERRSGGCYR